MKTVNAIHKRIVGSFVHEERCCSCQLEENRVGCFGIFSWCIDQSLIYLYSFCFQRGIFFVNLWLFSEFVLFGLL